MHIEANFSISWPYTQFKEYSTQGVLQHRSTNRAVVVDHDTSLVDALPQI